MSSLTHGRQTLITTDCTIYKTLETKLFLIIKSRLFITTTPSKKQSSSMVTGPWIKVYSIIYSSQPVIHNFFYFFLHSLPIYVSGPKNIWSLLYLFPFLHVYSALSNYKYLFILPIRQTILFHTSHSTADLLTPPFIKIICIY